MVLRLGESVGGLSVDEGTVVEYRVAVILVAFAAGIVSSKHDAALRDGCARRLP